MTVVGGDITEVTYNHPSLGSGTLYPKAGEDSTYDLGGPRSNDDASGITGAGHVIDQMNYVRPSFEVVYAWDKDTDTAKVVSDMAGSTEPADWTFTHINGSVYGMKGKPVGDIQPNGNAGTLSFKVSGGGTMKKIA